MDWSAYLAEHRHPTNRRLHTVGTLIALVLAAAAVWRARPKWMLWALAIGYGFAWAGHFLFERNRPATFETPVEALKHDLRLAWLNVTGQDEAELQAHGLAR